MKKNEEGLSLIGFLFLFIVLYLLCYTLVSFLSWDIWGGWGRVRFLFLPTIVLFVALSHPDTTTKK